MGSGTSTSRTSRRWRRRRRERARGRHGRRWRRRRGVGAVDGGAVVLGRHGSGPRDALARARPVAHAARAARLLAAVVRRLWCLRPRHGHACRLALGGKRAVLVTRGRARGRRGAVCPRLERVVGLARLAAVSDADRKGGERWHHGCVCRGSRRLWWRRGGWRRRAGWWRRGRRREWRRRRRRRLRRWQRRQRVGVRRRTRGWR
mmetsp:Transcript_26198/g.78216  ORF Transcript_26198/g.78216 Transcript_26198/m.78216 type:complete len:204 (-) Transcript_26198:178-789(-)